MQSYEIESLIRDHHLALLELIRTASQAIMSIKDEGVLNTQLKNDQSPVTQADLAAHQIIYNGLNTLFPHILVVSEEDSRSHHQRVNETVYWLVDPLDGTKEFINGFDDFTVNIALIVRDEQGLGYTRFGLMSLPMQGIYYSGGIDFGSQQHRWAEGSWTSQSISVTQPHSPLRVVTSRSHLTQTTLDYVERLETATTLVKAGNASKLCLIAQGEADLYPRLSPICEWDIAAGHAILEGAGGMVRQIDETQLITYGGKQSIILDGLLARGAC